MEVLIVISSILLIALAVVSYREYKLRDKYAILERDYNDVKEELENALHTLEHVLSFHAKKVKELQKADSKKKGPGRPRKNSKA